jgi:hypothetical protein
MGTTRKDKIRTVVCDEWLAKLLNKNKSSNAMNKASKEVNTVFERGMLGIPNFFPKSLFPNDVSTPHVIYHFEKCATISWDCDTSFRNQLLGKKFGMFSISRE